MKYLLSIILTLLCQLLVFSQDENLSENTATTVSQMAEYFKNILTEKGYVENQIVKDSLLVWSNINTKVNWTTNEEDQNRQHLKAIDNKFTDNDERINRYVKLFSYKIKQQIKEEQESKNELLSYKEILKKITLYRLFADIAKIESHYIGKPNKLIILISQNHGPKEVSQQIQDDIYKINKRLIENNICKVFGVENVTFKEIDDEKNLVFYNTIDTTDSKKYTLATSMRLEKDYGEQIFTSGIEDVIEKANYDSIQEVFFTTKRSSEYFKERRDLFQEKVMNERNEMIFNNMLTILKNTRKNVITLKMGGFHFVYNPPWFSDLPEDVAKRKCLTLQEICKNNNISYIHFIPKSYNF